MIFTMKNLFILLFLLPFLSDAQIITSVAGGGTVVGDGGPATAAILSDPGGCIFSKEGIFYIASGTGNRIRKIDTSGIITTIAGSSFGGYTGDGGQATAAKLNYPVDVTLDRFGNIFFSDNMNDAIRRIDAITGIITTICGNGISGSIGDGGRASAAQLYSPSGICFDKIGNLYIADLENNKIRKIDTSGIITTFAGTGPAGYTGDGIAATLAELYNPSGVLADDTGNIYIADLGNNRLRKVNISGIISTCAGTGVGTYMGDGMPATNAQFQPAYMKLDSLKKLYISDESTNLRVYKIDISGIFHCVAGNGMATNTGDGGPAIAASIDYPYGLALDKCNNLYISNVNYNRIRKITFDSTCDPYSTFDSASLNIKTITTANVGIYPNPAYSSITVTATNKINQITITNLIGQTVYTQVYDIEKAEVNIAGLPEGVYIVKVTDSEGNITVSKILKQ
jgi:hypothetical protein